MGIFKFGSKDNLGNCCVRFAYVDGIPNVFGVEKEIVDVTIDHCCGQLSIVSCLSKKRSATLALNKITDVRDITDTQIIEADKSVIGRAAIGGLLMGPLGSVIGGMSGIGKKKTVSSRHHYVIVSYISNDEPKRLVFEIVGASTGWKSFVADLPKDSNSPFAPSPNSNRPVEL